MLILLQFLRVFWESRNHLNLASKSPKHFAWIRIWWLKTWVPRGAVQLILAYIYIKNIYIYMIHPALAHFSGQRWSCCFKSLTQLSSPNERWRSNCQLLQSCMFQSAFSLVPLSLQGTGHLSAHQSSHWEWVWLRPQGHEDIVVVHSCQADMWSWCTWTNAMKWTALLIQRRKVTMVVQNSCGLLPAFSKLTKI